MRKEKRFDKWGFILTGYFEFLFRHTVTEIEITLADSDATNNFGKRAMAFADIQENESISDRMSA
jgi:hypothetical protein